jgi:hypothetical protein
MPEWKETTSIVTLQNFSDLSSQKLLFFFLKTFIDTLPRVSVTPQGTIPGMKVTDNLRKESIFSKLTKWNKWPQSKKHEGLGYDLAKNE